MKKIILIIAIAFVTVSSAFAQSQLYFGASGLGITTWTTNQNNYGFQEMDYAVRFGFGGNVTIGFDFNDHLGLKTEIGWASLGQNYKDTFGDTNTIRRNISMNYLQIPLLFKYRGGSESMKFYGAVGPQFNFLMNSKQTFTSDYPMPFDTITTPSGKQIYYMQEDITDRYESMDIMLRMDFGAEFYFTENLFLNAGLSFAYGLMDINATDWQIEDTDGNYNPSHNIYGGVQVGINYILPLGKK